MKIYCTSDLHGHLELLNPSNHEVCVIAGDIAPLSGFSKWHIHEQAKWMRRRFCSFCNEHSDVEFVIIPGNHDWASVIKYDTKDRLDNRIEFPNNVHVLIDSEITVKGIRFYGTPWVPIINHCWAYEAYSEKLKEMFGKIPEGVDMLIAHSPPRIQNESIDISLQNGRGPFGSQELTDAIVKSNPRYLICGHIHSGDHGKVVLNGTECHNVSRIDEGYEIAYEPTSLVV